MSASQPGSGASPAAPAEPAGSSSSSPSEPPTATATDLRYSGTPAWLHNSAIAVAVLGPVALLLPPRRADVRSFILTGGTFWATNQLAYDWTGRSIQQRFAARLEAVAGGGLPEGAKRTQALLLAEKARREAALPGPERAAAEAARRRKEEQGLLRRVWLGGEGDDWRAERERREKEALEDGRGYTGLITEQIGEAWDQIRGRKKEEGADASAAPDEAAKKPGEK